MHRRVTAFTLALAILGGCAMFSALPVQAQIPQMKIIPSIDLSSIANHPQANIAVSGTNFGASQAVDIYFDATELAKTQASATGTFTNAILTVPADTTPGTHYITAIGHSNGALSAQKVFTVTTDWAQFSFDAARTGYNPYENMIGVNNVANLGLAWSLKTSGAIQTAPVMAGNVLYVSSSDRMLYAIDPKTGTKLWTITVGDHPTTPAVSGGLIYIGASPTPGTNTLYAINTNGVVEWTALLGNVMLAAPTVAYTLVYITSWDNAVHAFNARTGSPLWTYPTHGHLYSSPSIARGVLYVGASDHKLYALDARSGSLRWSFSTGAQIKATASVTASSVYLGSEDSKFYAIDVRNGSLKSKFSTSGYSQSGQIDGAAAIGNGLAIFGANDGNVYALRSLDLKKLVWHSTTGGSISGSPAIANGVVYIGSEDGQFYAFDMVHGNRLWFAPTAGGIASSPVVADGYVYIGSSDGTLYAFAVNAGINAQSVTIAPDPSALVPDPTIPVTTVGCADLRVCLADGN